MQLIKPLSAWLNRTAPLPSRFYTPEHVDIPSNEWVVWLSIEEVMPLHRVQDMNWLGLNEAHDKTASYLSSASNLIGGLEGGWLDRWEQEKILETLGEPPLPSLPIYLITCGTKAEEQVVYVGKTKTTSRFSGGHSAALKLHAPKYTRKVKKIYRATIWFHYENNYISLDWIQPKDLALSLLDNIESHLIYNLQPELNTAKKNTPLCRWKFYIHVQNFLEGQFLNDKFF